MGKKAAVQAMLTDKALRALKAGEWASDPAARGAGRLQARKLAGGDIAWYYRHTTVDGKRDALPLGTGLDLKAARKRAGELSRRYQAGERDLRAVLEAEQREAERERASATAAEIAKAMREDGTLGVLLLAYCTQLARDGKVSAPKVEKSIRLHVEQAWPKLWATPAADVTPDDLLPVISRLADMDKLREADKLRSYLTAAYTAAVSARQNARALPALRELRITANPARDLTAIEGASKARDRALSVAELRAYWQRICALAEPDADLLKFHLLTGAQRVEQLARLTVADRDADTGSIRMLDGKGRRRKARVHVVPLLQSARNAADTMQGGKLGVHVFTVDQGRTGAGYYVLQHRVRNVALAMQKAGELNGAVFTVGDLRRTVETRLAAAGVGVDVRAQLQSHGLGGVQNRHYDRHNYAEEKRAALETLQRIIQNDQG
ncbi:hypothetical protein [Xanthomonas campestris]|uniref:hypothetical protein n=1 Tax=Xanthomonas campestris TaxID=339 RepID=UPI0035572E81